MSQKTPLTELLAKADHGDHEAALAAGLLFELGLEVKYQPTLAKKYYQMAAEAGNLQAQASLIQILEQGLEGLPPDPQSARQFQLAFQRKKTQAPQLEPIETNSLASRILVLDQNQDDQNRLSRALQNAGYQVIESASGLTGWEQLKLHPDIKAIFTEVTLDDQSGLQFLEKIRKTKAFETLPVIFVTSVKQPEIIAKAKKFGIHGWMLKPIDDHLLVKSADRWVRQKVS